MHKLYILFTFLLFSTTTTFANNKIDSIGVENNKGKKLILYRVDAKETYYSIAKKYNVSYKDIMTFNDSKFLQIGVILKVPTNIDFVASTVASSKTSNTGFIEYTIKAKDNLNMLAEKYGTTVDEIKRVNELKTINLQIGQVLKIPNGANNTETVAQPENKVAANPQPVTKPAVENKTVANENVQTVEHTIKAKENLNLLAEKYGTTVDEIKRVNGLSSNNLRIGQTLKIPSSNGTAAPVEEKVVSQPEQKTNAKKDVVVPKSNIADGSIEHVVVAGETIYSIAQKYGLTTYQLKTFSNLTSNEVSVGQKLIIKGAKSVAVADDEDESTGNANTIKDPSLKYAPSKYGLTQFEEKGTAIWIADQDLDASKMLVLHRTAPIGTVIKITNPMSNRTTYAKVVGKFTENESTKDVIIVMTKAVADAVGALDKRFFCNITYGAQENEQQK